MNPFAPPPYAFSTIGPADSASQVGRPRPRDFCHRCAAHGHVRRQCHPDGPCPHDPVDTPRLPGSQAGLPGSWTSLSTSLPPLSQLFPTGGSTSSNRYTAQTVLQQLPTLPPDVAQRVAQEANSLIDAGNAQRNADALLAMGIDPSRVGLTAQPTPPAAANPAAALTPAPTTGLMTTGPAPPPPQPPRTPATMQRITLSSHDVNNLNTAFSVIVRRQITPAEVTAMLQPRGLTLAGLLYLDALINITPPATLGFRICIVLNRDNTLPNAPANLGALRALGENHEVTAAELRADPNLRSYRFANVAPGVTNWANINLIVGIVVTGGVTTGQANFGDISISCGAQAS